MIPAIEPLKKLICAALAFLCLLGCKRSESVHEVKLVLIPPTGSSVRTVKVYLDGKDIGNDEMAYSKLEAVPFGKGAEIRLDISDELFKNFETPYSPTYCRSNFLHVWIMKGFRVNFFANGHQLDYHTLAFINPLKKERYEEYALHMVYNDPYTVWVVDGEIFQNAEKAVSAMKKWAWPSGSVALILFPKPEPEDLMDSYDAGLTKSIMNDFVEYLHVEKRIKVFSIGFGLARAGLPP